MARKKKHPDPDRKDAVAPAVNPKGNSPVQDVLARARNVMEHSEHLHLIAEELWERVEAAQQEAHRSRAHALSAQQRSERGRNRARNFQAGRAERKAA